MAVVVIAVARILLAQTNKCTGLYPMIPVKLREFYVKIAKIKIKSRKVLKILKNYANYAICKHLIVRNVISSSIQYARKVIVCFP